jgi:hypothetical protein
MSFSVRIVDAEHRSDLYAEIEYGGELVAEAFVEQGQMHIMIVSVDGTPMWHAAAHEIEGAFALARAELIKFELLLE